MAVHYFSISMILEHRGKVEMAVHYFSISVILEHRGKVEMAVHYFSISMILEHRSKVEILVFRTVQNRTAAVATNGRTVAMSEMQKIQNVLAVVNGSTSLALTNGSEETTEGLSHTILKPRKVSPVRY